MKAKKKEQSPAPIAVILMTYGSPKTLADVPEYLKHVYGGREPSVENSKEFQRRYHVIGGSPLIRITQEQATALEKELNKQHPNGPTFLVGAGMRFSHPFINEVVPEITKNAEKLVGIIMSPQYSPLIMSGYIRELQDAVAKLPREKIALKMATDWHLEPYFLKALAERVTQALQTFPNDTRQHVPVLFSAHSMPKRVIDKEPKYIADLQETASAVAKLAGLPKDRWRFCYQSAGHTPEPWLKPDFADIMPELKEEGETNVLIAPVQFLSDHLEILYDVEIGAREQAEKYGIQFARTESLNTSALFIKALAAIVQRTLQ